MKRSRLYEKILRYQKQCMKLACIQRYQLAESQTSQKQPIKDIKVLRSLEKTASFQLLNKEIKEIGESEKINFNELLRYKPSINLQKKLNYVEKQLSSSKFNFDSNNLGFKEFSESKANKGDKSKISKFTPSPKKLSKDFSGTQFITRIVMKMKPTLQKEIESKDAEMPEKQLVFQDSQSNYPLPQLNVNDIQNQKNDRLMLLMSKRVSKIKDSKITSKRNSLASSRNSVQKGKIDLIYSIKL